MDKISKSLNVTPINKNSEIVNVETSDDAKLNLLSDYDLARYNLRRVLDEAMALLPAAVSLAQDTESPRAYESTSIFIKTIVDINKDLLELSEKMIKHGSSKDKLESIVTNNALFVGTTEELFNKLTQPKESKE